MSLRLRLAYAFSLLAATASLLSLLGGYLVFRTLVERDIAQDLADLSGQVARALEETEQGPRLARGEIFSGTHYVFGFRLLQEEEPILEGGFPPEKGTAWRSLRTSWRGYTLEVSLRVEEYQRGLQMYLRAGLSLILPLLLLAGLLGYLMAGLLSRPLDRLSQAVATLSALRFPKPLPPGGDLELARLTQGFNRLVEAVQGALEREQLFTRYASHELRNPLAVLQAQLQAVKRGLIPLEEALPHLEGALRRMEAILQGLLALSRLEAADLAPVELQGFLQSYLRKRDEPISLHAREAVWVLAHPDLLERFLDNILDNAFLHGAPPVEVRLWTHGANAVLEVRDHGPGVPSEEKAKLTRPFYRGRGRADGLGLGLALAEQIVRRLGGTLEFAEANPGLRVRVAIPRWDHGTQKGL